MESSENLVEKIKDIDSKLDELKRAIDNLSTMMSALNVISQKEVEETSSNINKIKEADEAMKSLNSTLSLLNKTMGV